MKHDSDEIAASIASMYEKGGLPRGELTGWPSLDELYTVAGGQWTLVTGVPGMGKSEWLDALMVNLAERSDWHFGVWSPENHPVASHAVKLIEKRTRKPFGFGPNDRITRDELEAAQEWVLDRFTWIKPTCEAPLSAMCTAFGYARKPRRKFGIVLDPWNTLDHHDPEFRGKLSETEFVSETLTAMTALLRHEDNANVHLWIVAHPAKLYRAQDGKYPIPSGYDISGSAHWFNKADNIVCVHRDKTADTQDVDVLVQKVRFKWVGHVGAVTLRYDRVTGRYFEGPDVRIYDVTGHAEQYADPQRFGGS